MSPLAGRIRLVLAALLPLALVALLHAAPSYACSVARGYEPFKTDGTLAGASPPAPDARIAAVRRGLDDGLTGSCSDLASVTIAIDDSRPLTAAGYELRLVRGSLPQPLLPDGPVLAIGQDSGERTVTLIWFELPVHPDRHEALDADIEIRAVSPTGKRSEPVILHLRHEGGVRS